MDYRAYIRSISGHEKTYSRPSTLKVTDRGPYPSEQFAIRAFVLSRPREELMAIREKRALDWPDDVFYLTHVVLNDDETVLAMLADPTAYDFKGYQLKPPSSLKVDPSWQRDAAVMGWTVEDCWQFVRTGSFPGTDLRHRVNRRLIPRY